MIIKVLKEFSEVPGGRYRWQGDYSAEEFRDTILYPKFIEAVKNNEEFIVDLDGGYGYGSSFIEESFGGLARLIIKNNLPYQNQLRNIKIISNENISWISKIKNYIELSIDTQ